MAEAAGYPNTPGAIERVAKEQHIGRTTLLGWVKQGIKYGNHEDEVTELVEETRGELVELFDTEIRSVFAAMKVVRADATYRDLAIAAGIFTEKIRLLNDKPTSNVQQAITFERRGISTLPEHLTPGATEGITGSETV
jgi:hypothetical protein